MKKGKKFILLLLVFSLLALSGNLYAKKRGATLIIQRRGDQVQTRYKDTPWEKSVITGIRGELIAVKQNSLLLLDSESGVDVTIDIKEIKAVAIEKKSKALLGALLGIPIGFLVPRNGIQGTWGGRARSGSSGNHWYTYWRIGWRNWWCSCWNR